MFRLLRAIFRLNIKYCIYIYIYIYILQCCTIDDNSLTLINCILFFIYFMALQYIYIYVYVCVCVCVCVYIYIYIYIYMHTTIQEIKTVKHNLLYSCC